MTVSVLIGCLLKLHLNASVTLKSLFPLLLSLKIPQHAAAGIVAWLC